MVIEKNELKKSHDSTRYHLIYYIYLHSVWDTVLNVLELFVGGWIHHCNAVPDGTNKVNVASGFAEVVRHRYVILQLDLFSNTCLACETNAQVKFKSSSRVVVKRIVQGGAAAGRSRWAKLKYRKHYTWYVLLFCSPYLSKKLYQAAQFCKHLMIQKCRWVYLEIFVTVYPISLQVLRPTLPAPKWKWKMTLQNEKVDKKASCDETWNGEKIVLFCMAFFIGRAGADLTIAQSSVQANAQHATHLSHTPP